MTRFFSRQLMVNWILKLIFCYRKEIMAKVDNYVSHILKDVQNGDDEIKVKLASKDNKLLQDIHMDKSVSLFIFMAVYKFLVQDLMKTYICTQGPDKIYQGRIDWLKKQLAELRKCDPELDPEEFFAVKFFKVMKVMNDEIELVLDVIKEKNAEISELVKVDFELPLPAVKSKE